MKGRRSDRAREIFDVYTRDVSPEDLQRQIAKELGYELVGHRLELYGTPLRGRKPGPRQ